MVYCCLTHRDIGTTDDGQKWEKRGIIQIRVTQAEELRQVIYRLVLVHLYARVNSQLEG